MQLMPRGSIDVNIARRIILKLSFMLFIKGDKSDAWSFYRVASSVIMSVTRGLCRRDDKDTSTGLMSISTWAYRS